jgi:anti-sigma regulatory factor (Ser/Thr protein kinase)
VVTEDLQYELELPAAPHAVRAARHAVSTFGAGHGADGDKIGLAVSEAVGNAVLHAYPGGEEGHVRIRAQVDGDSVRVTVIDHGSGMRVGPAEEGHGWGLSLIGSVADSVAVESSGIGSLIEMTFARR